MLFGFWHIKTEMTAEQEPLLHRDEKHKIMYIKTTVKMSSLKIVTDKVPQQLVF